MMAGCLITINNYYYIHANVKKIIRLIHELCINMQTNVVDMLVLHTVTVCIFLYAYKKTKTLLTKMMIFDIIYKLHKRSES